MESNFSVWQRLFALGVVTLAVLMLSAQPAVAEREGTPPSDGVGILSISTQDLNTLTPEDLANSLVGAGVAVVPGSVVYTGANQAAGTLVGAEDSIGFDGGVVLSSGEVAHIVGPNNAPNTSTNFGNPGDADLTALSGFPTFDAAILEFDFEVGAFATEVEFRYVFGSEEYNEYIGTQFNDVFAFWVNGINCALINGDPVSINTVNNGANPNIGGITIQPTNPDFYINNDPFNPDITGNTVPMGDLLDTEMDGLTVVLTCRAEVDPGVNSIRLAIADAGDGILDAWVVIEEGSLTVVPPEITLAPATAENPAGTTHTVTATVEDGFGNPIEGIEVHFTVTGLNDGLASPGDGVCVPADCHTDVSGQVSWTYMDAEGHTAGTDTIGACFIDQEGTERCAKEVTKEWFLVTVDEGLMTGGGHLTTEDGTRVTFGLRLECDVDTTPNNLQVNWGQGRDNHRFHLDDDLLTAVCIDDPNVDPSPPPAGFDTHVGSGTGTYNGEPGATAEWRFTDQGQPGGDDIFELTITDAGGDVVLEVSGTLEGGNLQAH
jgi:hypothetical protein